ncbi:MAG: agmatine deiminase family protein [Bacteroidaceae bacterium]|nr:agmatine deiminase family protein [Bacteroidaceae bacterium]
MLLESHKDTVAFSDLFKHDYPQLFHELQTILQTNGCTVRTLPYTRDYWCRDFMPIQYGDGQYVQYHYTPDYLRGQRQYQTNADKVISKIDLRMNVRKLPLVIDGGNFVFCHGTSMNYIVMTNKVLYENQRYSPLEIEEMIRLHYPYDCVGIVWLPWCHSDMCGHSDGILRYVGTTKDGKPIVLANLALYEKDHAQAMRGILKKHFKVIELKLSHYDELSWAYINCLQTKNVLIVPGIGDEVTDKEALTQIKRLYPDYKGRVYQVQMHDFIAKGGGALNCCTWTICTHNVPKPDIYPDYSKCDAKMSVCES